MIELFKYHIRFVKKPTQTLMEEYSDFPIKLGLSVFVLYLSYLSLSNPKQTQLTLELLSFIFDINSLGIVYLYLFFNIFMGILNHYWIMPFLLNLLKNDDVKENGNSYRKIIFLSLLPYVTFFVIVLLPLKLLAVFLLAFDFIILSGLIKIVEGLLGIWLIVLIVQSYIMRWFGLKQVYALSNVKVFAIVFLFPLIASIPTLWIYGDSYLEFISKYLNF